MKPMHLFPVLILCALILGATRLIAFAEQEHAPATLELVNNTWQMAQQGDEFVVRQQVSFSTRLSELLRGSSRLDPAQLAGMLEQAGANPAQCQLADAGAELSLECSYRLPLPVVVDGIQKLPLPGNALLGGLNGFPVDTALGVQIETDGELELSSTLLLVPQAEEVDLGQGGHFTRRVALASLHRLRISETEIRLPGDTGAIPALPAAEILFTADYGPSLSSWLGYGAALLICLGLVCWLFPNRFHRHALAIPPSPPGLSLLRRFINWLHCLLSDIWPRLWMWISGTGLVLLGGATVWLALKIADLQKYAGAFDDFLVNLAEVAPLAPEPESLLWVGWPVLILLLGLVWILNGAGLLAHQEWARQIAAIGFLASLAFAIASWAWLVLLPPMLLGNLWLVSGLGSACSLGLGGAYYLCTHPDYRKHFRRSEPA